MEVLIEDNETCEKIINKVTFKSFEGCKQMCVRPLQPDQQITSVINREWIRRTQGAYWDL